MNDKEFKLLKIVSCITLLINNSAYLQQYVLSNLDHEPIIPFDLIGIAKYNKRIMDDLEDLIKEVS